MADLVAALFMSHSPFCYRSVEDWEAARARRKLRSDVPFDGPEEGAAKRKRIDDAFRRLREVLERARPDVLVVFGDDQLECFDLNNFPTIGIYTGADFVGFSRPTRVLSTGAHDMKAKLDHAPGEPGLAISLLDGLIERGFDPAFSMGLPRPDLGMSHSVMLPLGSLTDMDLATVPVLLNCYYAPQITARRSRELGLAIAAILEAEPRPLRVAVLGSGGLWHTPTMEESYLDEEFDKKMLAHLEHGDSAAMAEDFDAYLPALDDPSQSVGSHAATPLPRGSSGPQGGTREICNWIAAAAVIDRRPATVVDYVPVYASPIGIGAAYWEAQS